MRHFLTYRLRLLCLLALLPALLPLAASGTSPSIVSLASTFAQQIDDSSPATEIAQATPPAKLVKDIRPGQALKDYLVLLGSMRPAGRWLYFVVNNAANGTELWRTDGSLTHTALVSDLCPGPCSSHPYSLTALGDMLFFVTNDPSIGLRLWKTDGTPQGTLLIKEIPIGSATLEPSRLIVKGNQLFFNANDGVHGWELWRSDGTTAGTTLLKDIYAGAASAIPSNMVLIGNTLFFTAASSATWRELWKTDGTAAGTVLVKDIFPGAIGSGPANLTAVGTTLYFSADDGIHGRELWRSDGTAAGTQLVKDIHPTAGSDPSVITDFQGRAIFVAQDESGAKLWGSDGSSANTIAIKDIQPTWIFAANGLLFLSFFTFPHNGELWRSDGTTAGTHLVKDIAPTEFGDGPRGFVLYQGQVYFVVNDGTSPITYQIWRTDGTNAGTQLVKDIDVQNQASLEPQIWTSFGSSLYFVAFDVDRKLGLWKSDGTTAGTVPFITIGDEAASSTEPATYDVNDLTTTQPAWFTAYRDQLFWQARDSTHGAELWRSDGTAAGTQLVKDINPDSTKAGPSSLISYKDRIFFAAQDSRGRELWRSDGTSANTSLFADLTIPPDTFPPPPTDTNPAALTSINNLLYFSSQTGISNGVWRSDGSVQGTVKLGTLEGRITFLPLNNEVVALSLDYGSVLKIGSTPQQTVQLADLYGGGDFAMANNTLFFVAADQQIPCTCNWPDNYELWKTDGTAAGTGKIRDITPGTDDWELQPQKLTAIGNRVFFTVDDGTHGRELWVSDGTAAGTTMVKDILPTGTSEPSDLIAVGQTLYFSADDGVHGRELWRSDGTAAGTTMVKDLNTAAGSDPILLQTRGDTLLFSANDGVHGRELWRSDGTAAGTALLADIEPGPLSSTVSELYSVGPSGDMLMAAGSRSTGVELWQIKGNQAKLLQDLDPGPSSANPQHFTLVGSQIFFLADSLAYGREPWVLNPTTLDMPTSAANSTLFVRPGQTLAGSLPGGDPNGAPVQFTIMAPAQKGTVTLVNAATGSFRYQAQPNAAGIDTFSYRVSDGTSTAQGTITLVISERASSTYLPFSAR